MVVQGVEWEIYKISVEHFVMPESKEMLKRNKQNSTKVGIWQRDTGGLN